MEYVNLGRTGLKVSRIGLGAMAFGRPEWRDWVLDGANSLPILKRAIDLGINFFDTSNFYSAGASEEVLGRFIREAKIRDEVVIATKVGNAVGKGPNGRGYSRKHILNAVDDSLRRLGTDHIDLYQTHVWDSNAPIEEMIAAFDHLVRSGKVLHIGATAIPAWQFARCLYLADRSGSVRFATMQNHYNLIFREDERDLIPLSRIEGVALIPFSPLARGFLCGNREPGGGATTRARSDEYAHDLYYRRADFRLVKRLSRVAAKYGRTPAQVALAWILNRPGVTAPLVGTTQAFHVDEAVEALSLELTDRETTSLEKAYVPRALG